MVASVGLFKSDSSSCFRIDMSAVEGQSSRLSVILRGTQSSRLVQCFSSHPEELQVRCTNLVSLVLPPMFSWC